MDGGGTRGERRERSSRPRRFLCTVQRKRARTPHLAHSLFALLFTHSVIMTPHSAFLTHEALLAIKESVLASIGAFTRGEPLVNEVKAAE